MWNWAIQTATITKFPAFWDSWSTWVEKGNRFVKLVWSKWVNPEISEQELRVRNRIFTSLNVLWLNITDKWAVDYSKLFKDNEWKKTFISIIEESSKISIDKLHWILDWINYLHTVDKDFALKAQIALLKNNNIPVEIYLNFMWNYKQLLETIEWKDLFIKMILDSKEIDKVKLWAILGGIYYLCNSDKTSAYIALNALFYNSNLPYELIKDIADKNDRWIWMIIDEIHSFVYRTVENARDIIYWNNKKS